MTSRGARELLSSWNICHPDPQIATGKVLFTGYTLVEVLKGYSLSHTTLLWGQAKCPNNTVQGFTSYFT